eukprot:Tamp_14141.p1 GENE.Tamp_14141~~Tamp_14141.p1  ORF type:complete len:463 (-),score=32.52 Tamp_14141:177-1565(-)
MGAAESTGSRAAAAPAPGATTQTAPAAGHAARALAEEDIPSRVHARPVLASSPPAPPLSARGRLESSGACQTTVSPVAALLRPTAARACATRRAPPPPRALLVHAVADAGTHAPKNAPPIGPNIQRAGARSLAVGAAVGPPAPADDGMEDHALQGAMRLIAQTLQSKMLVSHGTGAQHRRSVPPSSSKGAQGSRPAAGFGAAERLPGLWASVLALCVLAAALGMWCAVQDARTIARGQVSTQDSAGWRLGTARGMLLLRRCDGHLCRWPAVAGVERIRSPLGGSGASLSALLSSPAAATRDRPLSAMHRLLQKVRTWLPSRPPVRIPSLLLDLASPVLGVYCRIYRALATAVKIFGLALRDAAACSPPGLRGRPLALVRVPAAGLIAVADVMLRVFDCTPINLAAGRGRAPACASDFGSSMLAILPSSTNGLDKSPGRGPILTSPAEVLRAAADWNERGLLF